MSYQSSLPGRGFFPVGPCRRKTFCREELKTPWGGRGGKLNIEDVLGSLRKNRVCKVTGNALDIVGRRR